MRPDMLDAVASGSALVGPLLISASHIDQIHPFFKMINRATIAAMSTIIKIASERQNFRTSECVK